MKIILLGAPGAGKGTQAKGITDRFNIVHISTGDIFRKNIKEQTEIGKIASSYINKGQLVPDEVTVELVRQRLMEPDCQNGYLLDGFPRNLNQAEQLSKFDNCDYCINLNIPLEKLVKRLTGRRICPNCAKSFHVDMLNGRTACDECNVTLVQRDDDHEEQVKARLVVYNNQTQPLIDYYKNKGVLIDIDADGKIEEISERVRQAIK